MKFIVVGLGSIGKRHKNNLESLGHQVIPCHRNDDLNKLLNQEKTDAALICNPTSLHIAKALMAAESGVNIFIEKPVSHNLDQVDKLLKLVKKKKLTLMVGYNLRWQSGLRQIKEQLDKKAIGKVYSVRIEAGSLLADWHPNEDHRQSYSAKRNLGGGVLLDLSHEIDYAVWFFGKAKKVTALLKNISELEIETEALAELTVEFESGIVASIHLDYLRKEYKRSCEIIGSQGQLRWNYIGTGPTDIDETYVREIENFIQAIKGKEKPLVTGEEAKHVLEIVEAAKKSSKTGGIVKL